MARVERKEGLIESVGERIVVWRWVRGRRAWREVVSRFPNLILPRGRLEVASGREPRQRLCRGLRYSVGYGWTTGPRDGWGAGAKKNLRPARKLGSYSELTNQNPHP